MTSSKTKFYSLLALLSAGLVSNSIAQDFYGTSASNIIKNAQKVHIFENNKQAFYAEFKADKMPTVNELITNSADFLHTDQGIIFEHKKTTKDLLGNNIYRYTQSFKGIPVEMATVILHEKNGKVEKINGVMHAKIELLNSVKLDNNTANIAAMLPELGTSFAATQKSDLVLYPILNSGLSYAYKVLVKTTAPEALSYNVIIDAENGSVLNVLPLEMNENVQGTAKTRYSGVQPITTDSIAADTFVLRQVRNNVNINIYNAQKTMSINNRTPFTDNDNIWDSAANNDDVATDAMWGIEKTYDFFQNVLNRNSFDGAGGALNLYVHWGNNWFNAQWGQNTLRFGDGNGNPLISLDVVGHELSHGVTQETADLIYQKESGALNESFSDLFGQSIEFYANPDSVRNWVIGDKDFKLRDMSNPNAYNNPDTYKGKFWTPTENCTPPNNDNCGVHNNSGVQNFWFYLLCEGGTGINDLDSAYSVNSITYQNAIKISYQNLSSYLSESSDYEQSRFYTIQSAIELSGSDTSDMVENVVNAWYAVGLGNKFSKIPVSKFVIAKNTCYKSTDITFKNLSEGATTYIWSFGDGVTADNENPTHQYETAGKFTVSLIACNSITCDTTNFENLVTIEEEAPLAANCTPNTLTAAIHFGIFNVKFGDIDNNSGNAISEKYKDFTCERATMNQGSTYPLHITSSAAQNTYGRVWIDYNNDGDFGVDELVMNSNEKLQNHDTTVTIPENATLGLRRVRVISASKNNNTPDNPCSNMRSGQAEDYAILITKSVSVNTISNASFSVYPNPANDVLNIEFSTSVTNATIKVVNMIGQTILNRNITGQNKTESLNIENLPAGIYSLIIQDKAGISTQKFIKN